MSLERIIKAEIAKTGAMGLDRYMSLCLMHPDHGYYTRRDPFGIRGDFVTAPEVSQMFGEMIGLWLAQVWQDQGGGPMTLMELGPGRGTLMADALRIGDQVAGFSAAVTPLLVEQSPHLRTLQEAALKGRGARWQTGVTPLPDGSIFLIANEFFDALPIRQAERIDEVWLERVVRLAPDDALRIGHQPLEPATAARLPKHARDGEIIEWSEAASRICASIGAHIAAQGGAALIIDYGSADGSGDTLQALRDHTYCSILNDPGNADLSAHVNFSALAAAAEPAHAAPLADQGTFLAALGIGQRAGQLAAKGDANSIADALERLTGTEQMGQLFKVLGLRPPKAPPLPALEAPC